MPDIFKQAENDTPQSIEIYTRKTFDILDRIHNVMQEEGCTQKDLADKLGKSESEISKWINGNQNFTLETLSKLEAALHRDIISIPTTK